ALVVVLERLRALVVLAPDVDGVVRAVELAHGAAHALLVLHDGHGLRDAAHARQHRRRLLHGDAVEGAAVDAVHAARALLQLHEGLGPCLRLDLLAQHAHRVEDGVVGAHDTARAAVDAQRGVDVIHLLLDAVDGRRGTAALAGAAAGTAVDDLVR